MGLSKKFRLLLGEAKRNPDLPLEECMRKAGFSEKRLSKSLAEFQRNPEAMAAFERVRKKPEKRELSQDEVVRDLDDIVDICANAGPGAWQVQARLKAVELKAKILGMLSPDTKVQIAQQINATGKTAVLVKFVGKDGAEIERLNASAAALEQRQALPEGFLGRLSTEPEVLAPEGVKRSPLKPEAEPLPQSGYCSRKFHGQYESPDGHCPICAEEGERELRFASIPATPEWSGMN